VTPAHGSHAASDRTGGAPDVADVLGDIAAAVTYLETLSERLHRDAAPPDERDAAAIPTGTLVAVRRSCRQAARHADRALAAMSPRRAAEARAAAAQLREVERLRCADRTR
jgi:hypothetical protein